MDVNSTHPDYDAAAPQWSRARDVIAGEDAVKAAGERYLPRLDSQSDEEYLAYRQRASFFNATAWSAEGFIGLIFRRPPFIKIPESNARPRPGPDTTSISPRLRPQPQERGTALAALSHVTVW